METHADRSAIVNEAADEYMRPTYDPGVTRRVGEVQFPIPFRRLSTKKRGQAVAVTTVTVGRRGILRPC